MSSVHISNSGLITQRFRGNTEELGRVVKDETMPSTRVLELKDYAGLIVGVGNYYRPGDRYSSWNSEIRDEILLSSIVSTWHMIWLRGLTVRDAERVVRENEDLIIASAGQTVNLETLLRTLRGWLEYLPFKEIQHLMTALDWLEFTEAIVEMAVQIAQLFT